MIQAAYAASQEKSITMPSPRAANMLPISESGQPFRFAAWWEQHNRREVQHAVYENQYEPHRKFLSGKIDGDKRLIAGYRMDDERVEGPQTQRNQQNDFT